MKIWIIGRGYPTTENRNWGSFEFEQAKLLSENGYEVVYIALTLSFFDRKDTENLQMTKCQYSLIPTSIFRVKQGFIWRHMKINAGEIFLGEQKQNQVFPILSMFIILQCLAV